MIVISHHLFHHHHRHHHHQLARHPHHHPPPHHHHLHLHRHHQHIIIITIIIISITLSKVSCLRRSRISSSRSFQTRRTPPWPLKTLASAWPRTSWSTTWAPLRSQGQRLSWRQGCAVVIASMCPPMHPSSQPAIHVRPFVYSVNPVLAGDCFGIFRFAFASDRLGLA